jgi:ABC-2 type transport system ATP-binding protein
MVASIVAESLGKRFPDDCEAVTDVSLSVSRGRTFGLVGGPGSGKSTVLEMLGAVITPSAGHAEVAGIDVLAEPERARENVGIVFQHPTSDPDRSARENLAWVARAAGLTASGERSRSVHLLEAVGLGEIGDAPVYALTAGQVRRLDLAAASVSRPEVLLLDEPTSALEPPEAAAFWTALRDLRRIDRMTVFVTSHRLGELVRECEQIAFIDHGHLIRSGDRAGTPGDPPSTERTRTPLAFGGSRRSNGRSGVPTAPVPVAARARFRLGASRSPSDAASPTSFGTRFPRVLPRSPLRLT